MRRGAFCYVFGLFALECSPLDRNIWFYCLGETALGVEGTYSTPVAREQGEEGGPRLPEHRLSFLQRVFKHIKRMRLHELQVSAAGDVSIISFALNTITSQKVSGAALLKRHT